MTLALRLRPVSMLVALLMPFALQAEDPKLKTAVWWNPAESGWGLFTFDQGNAVVPVWYTYGSTGEPTWFLVPSTRQADGSYVGDIQSTTGVPLAQISGQAADPATIIGRATTRFESDTRLVFSYTVNGQTQSKTLTRFNFSNQDLVCRSRGNTSRAAATNYSDIWWNPASSGWGMNLQHVGDALYATWYTYDTNRKAIFYLGTTTRQADGSYSGNVLRTRNGTPFLQISGAPPTSGSDVVGTMRLRFSDGQNATFDYTIGSVSQTKSISRFVFGPEANFCAMEAYPSDTGGGSQGEECIPPYRVGDFREYRVTTSASAAPITRLETMTGTTPFQGQTALVEEVRENGVVVGHSYLDNGSGTVAAFGADGVSNGQVISTSVNQPLRIERTRFFQPNQSVDVSFRINTTSQGFTVTSDVRETIRFLGKESVTTPAGTFQACKFELSQEVATPAAGLRATSTGTRWTSGVFGVVKLDTTTNTSSAFGSTSVTESRVLSRSRGGAATAP